MKINLGYQVYSAREEAEKDLPAILKKVAEIGYDGVEFAGFYGHSADEVRSMLEQTGLKAASSHVPYQTIIADMRGVIDYHKRIGCGFIAVPYLDDATRPGAPGFAAALRNIWIFGEMCKEAGIQLLYHNHDFEFVQLSGQYALDFLYEAVPSAYLATEIDTCWVRVVGEDPCAYLQKYAGRCPVIHLKDYVGEKKLGESLYALIKEDGSDDVKVQFNPNFDFRPLGYGVQDVAALLKAGLSSGAEWFIVEQDRSSERPSLEAARMSCETVRRIEPSL